MMPASSNRITKSVFGSCWILLTSFDESQNIHSHLKGDRSRFSYSLIAAASHCVDFLPPAKIFIIDIF